ncbi:MAG: hypothetical protein AAB944_01620 [Patescibacteria group bacterium]
MLLVKRLLNQASEVSLKDAKPPNDEKVGEGEVLLGVLNDDLKRLQVVMAMSVDELKPALEKVQTWLKDLDGKEPPEDQYEKMRREYQLAQNDFELARKVFWTSVYAEFPEGLGKNLSLREGWQVVFVDESGEIKKVLQELLDGIFP